MRTAGSDAGKAPRVLVVGRLIDVFDKNVKGVSVRNTRRLLLLCFLSDGAPFEPGTPPLRRS